MYAAGKIPGGFIKREARPSEAAILAARLTDRPIRPLFPEGYKDDVQLVITVLSTDQENDPDVLGTIAASAALTISEIPFQGPIGAVRVGRIDGEFVINPTFTQLAESELDLDRLRDARRDHDGRGRGEAPARGRHGRGDPVRPPGDPAAHRPPARAAGPRRQAEAAAVPRARHRVGPRLRQGRRGQEGARRRRRRDDRPRPEARRPRRDRRRPDQGRQDRRHVLDLRRPGSSDHRPPAPRDHRSRRQGRPGAEGRGREAPGLRRGRAPRRPQHRVRPRLPRGGPGRRDAVPAGDLPRHARPRPRGLSGLGRELQARRPRPVLRRRAHRCPPGAARCPGHRPAARPLRRRPAGPDRDPPRGDRDLDPGQPVRRRRGRPARRRPAPGTGEQEPVRARPQEDRPGARSLRGDPHGRPRSRRAAPDQRGGGAPAPRPRLRPVHPRRHPGPHRGHPRRVLGRPADRHDQPARPRSATSTTTTCRPTAPARTR